MLTVNPPNPTQVVRKHAEQDSEEPAIVTPEITVLLPMFDGLKFGISVAGNETSVAKDRKVPAIIKHKINNIRFMVTSL